MNFFQDIVFPPFELIWSWMQWLGAHPPVLVAAVVVVAALVVVVLKRR